MHIVEIGREHFPARKRTREVLYSGLSSKFGGPVGYIEGIYLDEAHVDMACILKGDS